MGGTMKAGCRVLCIAASVAVGLLLVPTAWSAVELSLTTGSTSAQYGAPVEFFGQAIPAIAGELVTVSVQTLDGLEPVASTVTGADGAFRVQVEALSPGPYVATAGAAQSEAVAVTIRARLVAALKGRRLLGGRCGYPDGSSRVEAGTLCSA